ncbi:Hypp763 [Branchiostoma lanceolatum]|uniref:Hypp763 protein n=1 Tax=Branchiostoma lanceolatum TaxID=7740 RepID=A0A8J9VW78_BRALA|nr:Hypp763 [Branchiostoma lanceolatum]
MATRRQLIIATLCGPLGGVLAQTDWAAQLRGEMNSTRIEEFLRETTPRGHPGRARPGRVRAADVGGPGPGMDSADIAPYDVLLSYPHPDRPSYVALLDDDCWPFPGRFLSGRSRSTAQGKDGRREAERPPPPRGDAQPVGQQPAKPPDDYQCRGFDGPAEYGGRAPGLDGPADYGETAGRLFTRG